MQLITLLFENPLFGILYIVLLILAIGLHESAHAYSAYWLGDNTPKLQKRLTLNPLAHLDPIGSLLILFVGIGWGKPVEFNPHNLKHPRRDTAIIAFAGPLTNIALAILCSILMVILKNVDGFLLSQNLQLIFVLLQSFALLNIGLAVFNLIPIEPLDGFKVVAGLLPSHLAYQWYQTRQYGMYILIVLLITGAIGKIMDPVVGFIAGVLL